jgi:hypothetical protein
MSTNFGSVRRIFSADKMINSPYLNILGAQVLRTVAARLNYRRKRKQVPNEIKEAIGVLESDGVVILPNFLPANQFKSIQEECLSLMQKLSRI